MIPEAVFNELTLNSRFQKEACQIKQCPFVKTVKVNETKAVNVLQRMSGLDLGESEAIVYADDNKADILLMDEAKGRQIAELMGIKLMGTIGILITAHQKQLISSSESKSYLTVLKNSNRRISEKLFKYAIEKIENN